VAEDDGFLMAIKINSTIFFRGKVKPLVPYHKIVWHVKDPYSMERDTCRQISWTFLPSFFMLHC
jgi:hypothetical protein